MSTRNIAGRHSAKRRMIISGSSTGKVANNNKVVQEKLYWDHRERRQIMKRTRAAGQDHSTVQVAGSRLPDCSHACGSCSPCRLVMVSFVCASVAEAETCPMAYKCMCRNKSYPVP
ncbi:EPIDERMAL PATTERNING FACTOR-like protein 6 [Morus notabilis]|nr:EPIDERMAL PATTERNING FACTOR-like protein 6 [Morus notabilis]